MYFTTQNSNRKATVATSANCGVDSTLTMRALSPVSTETQSLAFLAVFVYATQAILRLNGNRALHTIIIIINCDRYFD